MTTKFLDSEPPEPVTLADVRAWLKRPADYQAEDSLLVILLKSARLTAEKYTGLLFTRRQIEATFQNNSRRPSRLPYGPDVVIESVYRTQPGYADLLLNLGTDYNPSQSVFDPASLAFAPYWRVSAGLLQISYRAVYRAGYEKLPEDLKQAVLQIVAHSYRHKGDTREGNNREAKITSIPVHARDILDQYTILVA